MEEDKEDDVLDWRWYPVKRCLLPEHILFEDGDIACHLGAKIIPIENSHNTDHKKVAVFPCGISGCGKTFDNLSMYESHYNTLHRNICCVCRRVFPSNYLLDLHLLEWHDALFELQAAKQNMYQCLVENCAEKFKSAKHRKTHMIEYHKMPANYRFNNVRKPKNKPQSSKVSNHGDGKVSKHGDCKVSNRGDGKVSNRDDDKEEMELEENHGNTIEMEESKTSSGSKRIFSYKVPKNICFGQGSARGFVRQKRGRGRHWHQTKRPEEQTTVNIENIVMADLTDALNIEH